MSSITNGKYLNTVVGAIHLTYAFIFQKLTVNPELLFLAQIDPKF